MAAELAAGRTRGSAEGVSLYHMLLEGVVFDAGQRALLDELADGALPGACARALSSSSAMSASQWTCACACLVETPPPGSGARRPVGAGGRGRGGVGRLRPRGHVCAERAQGRPSPPRRRADRSGRLTVYRASVGVAQPGVVKVDAQRVAAARATDARFLERGPCARRRRRRPSARRRCRPPLSRMTGRSSARRAPASATCRPAAWASATSAVSASGESNPAARGRP